MAGKHILVIEPSATDWENIRDIFKLREDQAQWARSETSALELLRVKNYDLVLIEVLMPRGSGFALCEKFKNEEKGKNIPVLMMGSVLKNFKFAHDARVKYRANDILVKPFQPEDLERKLAFYLDGIILKEDGQRVDASTGEVIREKPHTEELRLNGLLSEVLFPRLLAAFWLREENGILHVQRDRIRKQFHFRKGVLVYVGGGSRRECLQQILFEQKIIDDSVFTSSLSKMLDTGKQQGETLMELGALNPHDLFLVLTQQAERKLLNAFSWSDGRYWFEPLLAVTPPGMVPMPLDLGKLLRVGVENYLPVPTLEEYFAEKANLAPHRVAGGLVRLERLNPTVQEKRVWALLDGQKTVAMLSSNAELPKPATYRLLYLLDIIGATVFAAPTKTPETQPWPVVDLLARSADPAEVEYREFIARRYLETFQQRLLDVLRVKRDAAPAEIEAAYLQACAGLLDEQRYPRADDLTRAKADAVFFRLSEAYEVISDPLRRSLHEQERASAPDINEGGSVQAELYFQKGLVAFSRGDYLEAADLFESAIVAHGRTAEYHAYLGYTVYQRDNERGPMVQSLAIERIRRALEIDPQIPEAHLFLANIYFAAGKLDKAEAAYEKAILYDPDNLEAHQRLWQIYSSRQTAAGAGEAELSPELAEYQDVIHEYFQRITVWNYYELLGVDETVAASELRKAYFQLSHQLRPTGAQNQVDPLAREKADEIFQRLTMAYSTLSNEKERSEYDRSLAARRASTDLPPVSPGQREQAEQWYEQGKRCFQKNDWKDALALFQRARQANSRLAANQAWLGYVMFKHAGLTGAMIEKTKAQAKAYLREALALDPACVEASVFLGQLYLEENKRQLARERFENALRTDPQNLSALQGYRQAIKGRAGAPARDAKSREMQRLLVAEYQAVSEQNFFDRLGASRDADAEEIQRAYQRVVEKYSSEDDLAETKTASQALVDDLIDLYTQAFQILSNSQLRKGYLQALSGSTSRKPKPPGRKPAGAKPPASPGAKIDEKPVIRQVAPPAAPEEPKKEKDFWRLIKDKLLRK